MAVVDKGTKLIDLMVEGMTPNEPAWGLPWIANMRKDRGAWEARGGFGVVCQYDTKLNAGRYGIDVESFPPPIDVNTLMPRPYGLERHLGSYLIERTSFGHKQVVSVWQASVTPENMQDGLAPGYPTWLGIGAIAPFGLWTEGKNKLAQLTEREYVKYLKLYVVHIYDMTTDEHWEEVLHFHTSQEDDSYLFRRHSNYESCYTDMSNFDRQTWVSEDKPQQGGVFSNNDKDESDEYFYFAEYSGQDASVRLFFGSQKTGAWCYCPADFKANEYDYRQRWMQVEADATEDWRTPYGESPLIIPVRMKPGAFFDGGAGLQYLNQADFGYPQAACVLDDRLVWAVENVLYFSDPETPNSIIDANVQAFSAPIVAVAPTFGNLIVWTADRKTYYYNPATGAELSLISGGRTTLMSSTVGIASANAWTSVKGGIVWIDRNGIYKNYGNTTVQKISDPVDPFFNENGLSNPITNYYTANGLAASPSSPTSFYQASDQNLIGVNVCYNQSKDEIIFNMPRINLAIVIIEGGYCVWNFESIVNVDEVPDPEPGPEPGPPSLVPVVKATKNLPFSWILTDSRDVYMVSGITGQNWTDNTVEGGVKSDETPPLPRDVTDRLRSGLLLQLDRGGGLDRSLQYLKEDRRRLVGQYVSYWPGDPAEEEPTWPTISVLKRDRAYIYVDKLRDIPVGPNGRQFAWTATAPGVQADDISPVWLPINFVTNYDVEDSPDEYKFNGVKLQRMFIAFRFDNTHWRPYINTDNVTWPEPIFNLEPERLGLAPAYWIGQADPVAQQGVFIFDEALGAPSQDGNIIVIILEPSGTPLNSWSDWPFLQFTARHKNPVLNLAFRRKKEGEQYYQPGDVWDLGIEPFQSQIAYKTPRTANEILAYSGWRVWRDHAYTDNQSYQPQTDAFQSVDWAYQGKTLQTENENVMNVRGVNSIIYGSGKAYDPANPSWSAWPAGLFNANFSTNYKQWAAQVIDYDDISPASNALSVRQFSMDVTRWRITYESSPGVWETTRPIFGQNATWGSSTNVSDGNFLVGDGPQNEVRGSANVKGEGGSIQLFGHITNAAERIRIISSKAMLRFTTAVRRWGRASP